ncbi:hypothetical protein THERMOT_107 [Bathymodiolus thermophilus thioautotrophic gill symbiont]|uniref:Uncharacterized protein n=1 Tax=Bathymodiolus thermophilus thioautotrophic gill symbiont TaxID=2360 RepID=A0A1J5TS43_9GAMM|nr:hypothetical protein [Bathymodiolus thermophilus thioautotrophic gill symbiont]OIR23731.1 hypothetical protein BGC33_07960 [Bathymodiolus thermophilus thioautotrophic gill symbiont]CAB5494441.1 hypothetical protein THERMOT_107 [Bathymodiolus thermophilus thioautotrophic gill symbiont]CAB5495980.1 hypothetical protein THERMOS_420 [Bathymodiolus thermophilus thioautotrophic gill symbiont]
MNKSIVVNDQKIFEELMKTSVSTPESAASVNYLAWLEGDWLDQDGSLFIRFKEKTVGIALSGRILSYVSTVGAETTLPPSPNINAYALIGMIDMDNKFGFALYLTSNGIEPISSFQLSFEVGQGVLTYAGTLSKKQ